METKEIENKINNARVLPVSNPGRFYGTAKLDKLPTYHTIEELPIRPVVSNVGTASYRLEKYLAKNLSPL